MPSKAETRVATRICCKCHKHSRMAKYGFQWRGGRKVRKYQCPCCGTVSSKMKVA